MSAEKEIEKALIKRKTRHCKQDKGRWFPYKGEESDKFKRLMNSVKGKLLLPVGFDEEGNYIAGRNTTILFGEFEDLSYWYLLYSQYLRVCKNDKEGQKENFIYSALFGYLHAELSYRGVHYAGQEKVTREMSQCLMCGWFKEADSMGKNMVASINLNLSEKCRDQDTLYNHIGTGSEYSYAGWFILDLYCEVSNVHYEKKHIEQPKNYLSFYGEALEHWNSKDLKKIDQLVSKLCDFRLLDEDNQTFEFGDSITKLFPYEIHAWMVYRERVGLENPSSFSHPLMNQLLGEDFEGARPFPKPYIDYLRPLFEKYENVDCKDRPKIMDILLDLGKEYAKK